MSYPDKERYEGMWDVLWSERFGQASEAIQTMPGDNHWRAFKLFHNLLQKRTRLDYLSAYFRGDRTQKFDEKFPLQEPFILRAASFGVALKLSGRYDLDKLREQQRSPILIKSSFEPTFAGVATVDISICIDDSERDSRVEYVAAKLVRPRFDTTVMDYGLRNASVVGHQAGVFGRLPLHTSNLLLAVATEATECNISNSL